MEAKSSCGGLGFVDNALYSPCYLNRREMVDHVARAGDEFQLATGDGRPELLRPSFKDNFVTDSGNDDDRQSTIFVVIRCMAATAIWRVGNRWASPAPMTATPRRSSAGVWIGGARRCRSVPVRISV